MKQTIERKASYTFREECDVCGQKPVLKDLGMCSVCTFGEADSLWEWLGDGVVNKERNLAEKYVIKLVSEIELIDKNGSVDPIKAALLHVDQNVLDKIEELL